MLKELDEVVELYLAVIIKTEDGTKSYCNFVLHGLSRTGLSTTNYRYGKKHGKSEMWDYAGNKVYEENYSYGVLHGKYWSTTTECEYVNGRMEGKVITKHDGVKTSEYTIVKNVKHGIYTRWRPNGTLESQTKFVRGSDIGSISWHPNGKLLETKVQIGDLIKTRRYHENGKIHWINSYRNASGYEGLYLIYQVNGRLFESRYYINGVLNGKCKTYNEHGQLLIQISYVNGFKHGKTITATHIEKYCYDKLTSTTKR
jgi:antitoxin component YwqK of YwqJK toxin-antitoxin module